MVAPPAGSHHLAATATFLTEVLPIGSLMNNRIRLVLSAATAVQLLGSVSFADEQQQPSPQSKNPRQIQFFENKIRPVLVKHCYECHSADSDDIGGHLRLDTRQATLKGGESGPAVVPGDLKSSLLMSAIEYRDFEMPPDAKLPDSVIRDFRKWIQSGAADPRKGPGPASPSDNTATKTPVDLWSLQPVQAPEVPDSETDIWSGNDIDRFVLRRLTEHKLKPVNDAGIDTLLRRTTIDLTGLPPTIEQQRRFGDAAAADLNSAMEQLVDELLASPQFGERWGRHWMDAVRYAESAGNSRDVLMPWAWRYRDYIIDAFNNDVPYNQFLTEQIAGDLLPAATSSERDRLQIATGFLAVGSKSLNGGNLALDIPDDQIDVIGKSVLALTISCARCHDHKFDPIPTADYYGLVGIFRSTETLYGGGTRRPKKASEKLKVYLPLGEDVEARTKAFEEQDKQLAALTKKQAAASKQLAQLRKTLPENWKAQVAKLRSETSTPDNRPNDKPAAELTGAEEKLLAKIEAFEQAQSTLKILQDELKELKQVEQPELEFAVGVRDKSKAADSPIYLRGDKSKPGQPTPRGFLSAISVQRNIQIDKQHSGRLELAQWLTQPDHPLTSRVLVNRVWQHLYGRGLVESVDNFGVNGNEPTHPELLDWLAYRFVHRHRWSIKSLIREMILTRTYRLSSDNEAGNYSIDPANTYLWRMSRRRLEAEPLRDSILAASGQLKLERPLGSAVMKMGEGEVGRGIKTEYLTEPFPHRTVYLPILRTKMPAFLKTFDYPEPSNPQGLRDSTNVPAQSLFLMNSPFVLEQSQHLASRVLETEDTEAARLNVLWQLVLGRLPNQAEVSRAREFLSQIQQDTSIDSNADTDAALTSWSMLGQALFASAEFRYLQ